MRKLILCLALVSVMLLNATHFTNSLDIKDSSKIEMTNLTEVSTLVKLITKGDYEAVKSMVVAGTDINKKSKGLTPLMFAARLNKADIVTLLIKHGADLKVKSDRGYNALEYAEMSKAHDTYKIIDEAIQKQKLDRKKKRKRRKA